MAANEAIRRAAGVIAAKMHGGMDRERAVAFAIAREPQLTDDEIEAAAQWAESACLFSDMSNLIGHNVNLGAELPDDHPAHKTTIGHIRKRAGLPKDA